MQYLSLHAQAGTPQRPTLPPFSEPMNNGRVKQLLLLVILAGIAAGCEFSEDPPPVRILVPREVDVSRYITTESGLQYYDFVIGDGQEADSTDRVKVHYAGWLSNERLIGSSYLTDLPITINLASDAVVEGWTEGIPGMREGGERQLVVPPELAYGETGFEQAGIPPNATLIYEIELVSIESDG